MILTAILLLIILVSLYTDLTRRKIYNVVTVTGAALGLIFNLYAHGSTGIMMSLQGLGLGLAVFLLPYLGGGLGAGDIKLMAAVGAIKGPEFILMAALYTAACGGLLALIMLLKSKRIGEHLARIGKTISLVFLTRKFCWLNSLNSPTSETVPYGAAIFAGVLLALTMGW